LEEGVVHPTKEHEDGSVQLVVVGVGADVAVVVHVLQVPLWVGGREGRREESVWLPTRPFPLPSSPSIALEKTSNMNTHTDTQDETGREGGRT